MIWILDASVTATPTAADWTSYLQTGGTIGVLTMAVIGFVRGWIVPGGQYARMEKERDYYREVANDNLKLADRQTVVTEVLMDSIVGKTEQQRAQRLSKARAQLLRREESEEDEG